MVKHNFTRFLATLAVVLIFTSCNDKISKVVIISTNDVHSAIDRFPRLATLVEQYRAEDSTNVLLMDAGDRWTGNPFVDLAQERCYPIIELYNTLGYNVGTMGNHEFDFGLELLAQRMNDAKFSKVLANAKSNGSAMPEFAPYTFVNVNGKKIGILGLVTVTPTGYPDGDPAIFSTASFSDPYATAKEYAHLQDSCDVFIALTHIGYPEDSLLAVAVPELDLIVGGHSHTVLDNGGVKVGATTITQTGRSLKYAGVTTITFKGDKPISIENQLIDLDTIIPSPRYQAMVDRYNQDPTLMASVGKATDTFNRIAVLNLMSDVMREGTKSDIGLYNVGGVRITSLAEGDIRVADVYSAEPFSNEPAILEMSESEIRDLIIRKYNSQGKESHKIDLYPSGMEYEIKLDKQGEAVDVEFDFDKKKATYKVAMSDYINVTYDFAKKGTGAKSNLLITNLMMDYLSKKHEVSPDMENRAEVKSPDKE